MVMAVEPEGKSSFDCEEEGGGDVASVKTGGGEVSVKSDDSHHSNNIIFSNFITAGLSQVEA